MDERPDHERSPSPEPIYNEQGARINTKEFRAKDKLYKQRNVSSSAKPVGRPFGMVAAAAATGSLQTAALLKLHLGNKSDREGAFSSHV